MIISDCVRVVGHSPNVQTLLHVIVSASIMASPTAFSNSDGMLSIPSTFLLFRDLTAASTSSRSTENHHHRLSEGNLEYSDLRMTGGCKCLSSILSIYY